MALLTKICAPMLVVAVSACSQGPRDGNLLKFKTPSGEEINYVALMPENDYQTEGIIMILALPSGYEEIADACDDADEIWSSLPNAEETGIVIPSSDTSALLSRTESASFAHGAAAFIGPLLDDVEERFGLKQVRWVAADIGGNGDRLVRVLHSSEDRIRRGYLVPSFSFEESSIDEAIRLHQGISVIIGNRPLNRRELRINDLKEVSVEIAPADQPPLYEVADSQLRATMRDYASAIVDMATSD